MRIGNFSAAGIIWYDTIYIYSNTLTLYLTVADRGASYKRANSPSIEPLLISRIFSPLIVISRIPLSTM